MLSAIELKEKVKAMGADLVGVADAQSPLLYEHNEKPEKLLPGARSMISIAVALNRPAVCSGNLRLNRYDTMCVYERLNHICMETVRTLANEGAKAVSISPYFPVDMGPESKGMKGDINHKTVAAVAGLGGIGLSRLLVTPEFGPLVRLGTIITDASLSIDQPLDETPCKRCESCRNACPAEAIQEDGTLNYRACSPYTLSNALPGIIGVTRNLIGADEKKVKDIIYSPHFWEIWQATTSSSIYSCSECMAACPVGLD